VKIEHADIHGLRVCRTLDYYVDPDSLSNLELGTKEHPYKSVNLPILELFNFLSNMDITVKIKLSQEAMHYFKHSFATLNNVTSVTFEPYNKNSKNSTSKGYSKKSF
jgi:hypothetical protein